MITCPYCGHEEIDGVDSCGGCGHSLVDLSFPEPATKVEASLLADTLAVLNPRVPLEVSSDTPTGDVLDLLVEKGVGCTLIVDEGELIGIFSERDALLRLNVDAHEHKSEPISKFMTPEPQCLDESAMIAFCVQRMDQGGYRHVPVVKDGKPIGIVSVRDILRYLTEKMED